MPRRVESGLTFLVLLISGSGTEEFGDTLWHHS